MEIKILNNWNKEHEAILNKINNFAEMPDDIQVQKNKFALLSELLLKLCITRDIRSNFKNLTSLIILFLNVYKKNYPVDVYSKGIKKNHLGTLNNDAATGFVKQELLAGK